MITKEEYEKAKNITTAYEREQGRLHKLKVEAFRRDLEEYFKDNPLDGKFKVEEFRLDWDDIIPIKPPLEECYEGRNDLDIKKIAEKHKVNISMAYWVYHK